MSTCYETYKTVKSEDFIIYLQQANSHKHYEFS